MRSVSGIPGPAERKRRARAAWGASLKDAKKLNVEGVPYGTLKDLLARTGPAPTLEQALAIADACGVPQKFILTGDLSPDEPSFREELEVLAGALISLAIGDAEQALSAAREVAEQLRDESARGEDEQDRPGERP